MQFMMIMIPSGYATAVPGVLPSAEAIATMSKYNEALTQAGVLRSVNGLHPGSEAVRISFSGGKNRAVDGPFSEAKELIGGYWIIEVGSKQEAVDWALRVPLLEDGSIVELRQVQDIADFPPELQAAAGFPPPA